MGYGGAANASPNALHFTVSSSTNRYQTPNGSFPPGWKGIVVLQLETGTSNLRFFWCPVQSTAPVDASAVQGSGIVYGNSGGISGLSRTQISIGARGDGVRGLDQTLARVALLQGNLTQLEIARMAFGEELVADLGKSPLVYLRMNDSSDVADRGSQANTFATTGNPTTGADPGWGYVPAIPSAPAFTVAPSIDATPVVGQAVGFTRGTAGGYPTPSRTQQWLLDGAAISGATGLTYTPIVGDSGKALTVQDTATNASAPSGVSSTSAARTVMAQATGTNAVAEVPHKVIQRLPAITGTSAPVSLSGTYDGLAVSADVRLLASDGVTVSQDWTPLTAGSFVDQVWSGKVEANQGGPYKHQVRFKNAAGTVIGTTPVATTTWNVGALFAVAGSSTGEGWFTTGTFTARSDVFKYRFSTWSSMSGTSNGPACLFANAMAIKLGVPIGMVAYASSGTTLGDWLNNSSTWTSFANATTGRGGKFEGVLFSVGSNDANESAVSSIASHASRLRQLIARIKAHFGQGDELPFCLTGMNGRLSAPPAQADFVHEAENLVGEDVNVCHVQSLDLEVGGDNTHLTGAGYETTIRRVNFQWPLVSGLPYRRGPKPVKYEFTGSRVRVTVQHRSGTQVVVPTNASGVTVSDANGARTITGFETISATQFEAICDQPLVAPVVTKHMAGNWPARTAPILDNSATPLPMAVETLMATTQGVEAPDTTAPAFPGGSELSVSNITNNGATLTVPAATDAVGVAGYQVSINGGTSYNNAPGRVVPLTGLPAGTTYQIRMRAYDAALNYSTPLAGSFTTLSATPEPGVIDVTKVPPERRVVFEGSKRVVSFQGSIRKVIF